MYLQSTETLHLRLCRLSHSSRSTWRHFLWHILSLLSREFLDYPYHIYFLLWLSHSSTPRISLILHSSMIRVLQNYLLSLEKMLIWQPVHPYNTLALMNGIFQHQRCPKSRVLFLLAASIIVRVWSRLLWTSRTRHEPSWKKRRRQQNCQRARWTFLRYTSW